MDGDKETPAIFSLRLAASLRELAKAVAHRDGISLNRFINMAVAEKIARLQEGARAGRR
jgi:predicted HicB family RNase H-like nuclease